MSSSIVMIRDLAIVIPQQKNKNSEMERLLLRKSVHESQCYIYIDYETKYSFDSLLMLICVSGYGAETDRISTLVRATRNSSPNPA